MTARAAISSLVLGGALLAACSQATAPTEEPPSAPTRTPPPSATAPGPEALTRVDSQGAVTIEVTPLNLDAPGPTLDFAVVMETHAVDLSMDLAALATLSTDDGRTVRAEFWDAPLGGHHVAGTLSFPAETDGRPILEGARELKLTLRDVDAPERVFAWRLER